MDRAEALAILDLPQSATEAEVARQADLRRAELEKRIANAPTFPLKAKYRSELARLDSALDVLHTATPSHDIGELPVMQKIDADEEIGFGEMLHRQPQASAPGTRQPPQPPGGGSATAAAAAAPPRRAPPSRSTAEDSESVRPAARTAPRAPAPPAREPSAHGPAARSTGHAAPPVHEDEAFEPAEPPPPRPPRPAWVLWTVLSVCLLFLVGGGYAGWRFWYVPKVERENTEIAVRLLNSVGSQASSIQDTVPKVRSLAWVAVACGSAGSNSSADALLAQGRVAMESMTAEPLRSELECRLLVAQAAKGDPGGALSQLTNNQAAREKMAKPALVGARKSVSTVIRATPVNIPPIREDMARRGIAITQARQGKWQEAQATINGIFDDRCACEAMAVIVDAMVKAGEKSRTITLLQTMEERAKKVTDAAERATLLCAVAERMSRTSAKTDLKNRLVKDALGAASSGSSSGTPTAGVIYGQARVLRSLWRTKDKDGFEKRIVEVTGSIGNLNGTLGTNNQRPDFGARAKAYAAIALAWNEAGNEENAAASITSAISAAEQARLPVEGAAATAGALNLDLHKQRALAAVARALAEMRQFDQAEEILAKLTDPGELAEAGEAIAYWLGWEGEVERGESIAARLTDGEGRCRCVVALQYGVRHADLERWW